MKKVIIVFTLLLAQISTIHANTLGEKYIEAPVKVNSQGVWLTFDACGGDFDWKLAQLLVDNHIPSSIFVTSKWLKKNKQAIEFLKQHKDIFTIENHGENHLAAIYSQQKVYNVPTVQDRTHLEKEVFTSEKEITDIFGRKPHWFRGATALYDKNTLTWFQDNNINVAGYSISLDYGAKANEKQILNNFQKAKNGQILLMHINKPLSPNAQAFKKAIPLLKELNILKQD